MSYYCAGLWRIFEQTYVLDFWNDLIYPDAGIMIRTALDENISNVFWKIHLPD
jgi:hypothetical protein